jgi:hypothetical protein
MGLMMICVVDSKKFGNGSSKYDKDEGTDCKDRHTKNSKDGKSHTDW